MRCSRPSCRRRNARLCRSDRPPSARYDPIIASPARNGTAPPRAFAMTACDVDGTADALTLGATEVGAARAGDADGDAAAGVVVGAAASGRRAVEQAAGS